MQDQHDGPDFGSPLKGLKNNFNATLAVCQALAGPIEAVLRRPGTVGERYFGGHAALGTFLMFVTVGLGGGPYAGEFAIGSLTVACIFFAAHKSATKKQDKAGNHIHSRYSGRPWLPGKNELKVKSGTEPGVAFLAGVLVSPLSPGLALYLVVAAIGLACSVSAQQMEWNARKRTIRDSMEEQKILKSMMQEVEQEQQPR